MNEGLIPRRYAKALYMYALDKHVDEKIYQMMKTLASNFEQQSALQDVLSNPYVAIADKKKLLTTAAGASSDDTVYSDFLKLLEENRRLDMARGIAIAYMDIYREANKIYDVKLVSAALLTDAEYGRLRSLVQQHLHGGTMEFTESVDPSLIGGFTVSVGNERIDASVSNELKQLRLNLLSK